MTTFYSEHYAAESSASVAPATELPAVRTRHVPGIDRTPMYVSRVHVDFSAATTDPDDGDMIRLLTLRSSDRLHSIWGFWGNGEWVDGGGVMTGDLGLFHEGAAHDGAEIDDNMFATLLTVETAQDFLDHMTEAGTVPATNRMARMWEIANLGLTTPTGYTEDPQVNFDIVFTFNTVTTITTLGHISYDVWFQPSVI